MKGKLSGKMLEAVLDALPVEFSVLDTDDKVAGWNKHDTRIFKRPEAVVGRDMRDCHPKKSLDKVERILAEMKKGSREKARFWIDLPIGPEKNIHKILIEYFALRDDNGNYLGCLEASRDITEIQKLEGQKRLLD